MGPQPLTSTVCPLTPLENRLRAAAGQQGYEGDFVERYVIPVLYPDGLRRDAQVALGVAALAITAFGLGRPLLRLCHQLHLLHDLARDPFHRIRLTAAG